MLNPPSRSSTCVAAACEAPTTADANAREDILRATRQLLALMIRQNGIQADDVGTALFTTSPDLNAEFPALAARQLGWLNVPLMCGHEMNVPGSLQRCVRVLLNWNTEKTPQEIKHVYIKDAVQLRPDLSKLPPVDWDELEAWIAGHSAAQGTSGRNDVLRLRLPAPTGRAGDRRRTGALECSAWWQSVEQETIAGTDLALAAGSFDAA